MEEEDEDDPLFFKRNKAELQGKNSKKLLGGCLESHRGFPSPFGSDSSLNFQINYLFKIIYILCICSILLHFIQSDFISEEFLI